MPTRRKTTAAAASSAALATPALDGCVIALSGKFDSHGYTSHRSLEETIRASGGTVSKSVTSTTTHVVCSEEDYKKDASKVAAGRKKDLPLVSLDWVEESVKEKKQADAALHSWAKVQSKGTSGTKPNGTAKPASAAGRKRSIATKNGGDVDGVADTGDAATADDEVQPKKTKRAKPNNKQTANSTTKTSGKTDDSEDAKQKTDLSEKAVGDGQFTKKNSVLIPPDEYCPLTTYQVYVDPNDGMIYDASLNQSNATHNNNKFYRIQVLVEPRSGSYKTWTRWGRVGETGQNALLGNGTLDDSIKNFEKKFRDKSGLPWSKRGDNPKPGKYAFIERSYNSDSDDDDDEQVVDGKGGIAGDYKTPKCTLEKPVQDLMGLIFNQEYFQNTMAAMNYDATKLPLGKLSKTTITRGFQQLKELAVLLDDPTQAPSRWTMAYGTAVEHLSNTYYSLIPHDFGRNRPIIINSPDIVKKEIELLESLSDMKDAVELMKLDRKLLTQDTVHPLDRQFRGLGLQEMTTLDPASKEYQMLSDYLTKSRGSTHGYQYNLQDIFRIERQGEAKRFSDWNFKRLKSDRRLLWHGSRCTNFGGILSQGLRIAPPEAPVSGYMFGKGIYLADMSSKSAGYCCHYNSNGHALLLLCEAELGTPMYQPSGANYEAGEDAYRQGAASTWGRGRSGPTKWIDAGKAHASLRGVKMPDCSKPIKDSDDYCSLLYNEYICYDIAQVKLRYLFRVKM